MDFKDAIMAIAERVLKIRENVANEEATKTAMVMPFIQALGYNVFDPTEVVPEFTADVANRKGEKIDYCLQIKGAPAILIECKPWTEKLTSYKGQLQRYFNCTDIGVAILTNGIIYEFYTDLAKANMMDDKPFLIIDLAELTDAHIFELQKFSKQNFDYTAIYRSAGDLWLAQEFKNLLKDELTEPSVDFIKFCIGKMNLGWRATNKLIDQLTPIAHKAFNQYIADAVTLRLRQALDGSQAKQNDVSDTSCCDSQEIKIVTTADELQGFYIVRGILVKYIDIQRIVYRDAQTYFAVLLDDNNRKPLCRLYLNGNNKYFATFDENKKEVRHLISSLSDIYQHAETLISTLGYY